MDNRRKISKKQNRGKGCAAPWSDLNHHLLYLVFMKLEVIDFVPFSGVCKSWRSLALPNKTMFISSRPPMSISISEPANKKEYWFEDFQGKMFKMRLPKSGGGKTLVGITCGYLVFFGTKPREFQLLNPVTRHGLRFPRVPGDFDPDDWERVRAILVFSPSISSWMLLVLCRCTSRIWFSIAGTREWDYVYSKYSILDIHGFKGKIYAIDTESHLFEIELDPEPQLMLLRTQNILESDLIIVEFVCTGENLYVMECISEYEYEVHELDFGEMKWVSPAEKTMEEYAFFVCNLKHSVAIKPETEFWSDSWSRYKSRYTYMDIRGNGKFFSADIWYFNHDCLKVNLKHE